MVNVLVPATLGAVALRAYGQRHGIDTTSAAIGGAAVGLGGAALARKLQGEKADPAQQLSLATAMLGLIAYDRWHDGMWPFQGRGR